MIGLAPLFSCPEPAPKMIPDTEINDWFNSEYEELLQMSPLQLTAQVRKNRYGEIDDISQEAEDKKLAWMEPSVQDMKGKFEYDLLSEEAKVSYGLRIYQNQMEKGDQDFRRMNYVLNQMTGPHTQLPIMIVNSHKVDEASDMEALISRYKEDGGAISQLLEDAKIQSAGGIQPSKFAFE